MSDEQDAIRPVVTGRGRGSGAAGQDAARPGYDVPGIGPVVENEFASVAVSFDERGNAVRLRLEDLRGGRVRYLDALELETIVWLTDEHLSRLLDPSSDRWR